MRIKRAATLVCTFEGTEPVVHNFLKKEMYACRGRALDLLAALDYWRSMEGALATVSGNVDDNAKLLRELIRRDLVLIEGSPQAERDQHYQDNWRWGSVAAFYHFSLRDSKFVRGEATAEILRGYGGWKTSPPLMTTNEGLGEVTPLPEFDTNNAFYRTLFQRRSRREYSGKPISQLALADCLFAGNGLKEYFDAGDLGRLPLTMTPSGGARNPFELYVYVRAVEDLRPGFYHYSAPEHSLGLLHADALPSPVDLLGDQDWTREAAAIVFLCATFERSAWKYRQALAYRVVLMEVGAIVQNIQLAATHRGVAAAPTGALAESEIERLLALTEIEQAALFAVVLGDPT